MSDSGQQNIAAISTAYGQSGIGIVRMSGPDSLGILASIFISAAGESVSSEFFEPRKMRYGFIVDPCSGKKLDEVLCVFMKAPATYTAENLVEIHCHGSAISLKNILALCLDQGAALAEPGEFTKRAFLNGRIDLVQAEAVIDLIQAKSNKSFDVAIKQVEGSLSAKIEDIRKELLELLVSLTVNMDYPDEDIEEITYGAIEQSIMQIGDKLDAMLLSAGEGRILREGLAVTIVGKPNVGKSSLMNFFLGENRAIVTEIPGTTRDTIQEQFSLRGIPIRLTDTAGIRDSQDLVERLGIERSKDAFNKADLLLFLIDASQPLSKEDKELCALLLDRYCIVLLNKADLPRVINGQKMSEILPLAKIISTSLKEGIGLEQLEDTIEEQITGGKVHGKEEVLVTNIRHIDLLKKAKQETQEAMNMALSKEAIDFIEVNVRAAFDYLGEIIGKTSKDEIMEEIFSRFCLGK